MILAVCCITIGTLFASIITMKKRTIYFRSYNCRIMVKTKMEINVKKYRYVIAVILVALLLIVMVYLFYENRIKTLD